MQAVKDTGIVLAILTGVTIFLFVSNTVMADLSSKYLQGSVKSNPLSQSKKPAALTPPQPTQQAEKAIKSFPDL